jgi:cell wall-associated NlpC family hydrolase/prophage tail gpP-like protein
MTKAIATITSRFGGRGYTGLPVNRVKNYTIDSAMDTDSDQWSIDIGDPRSQLIGLLRRDSEVRIRLAAHLGGTTVVPLLQGYADQIGLTEDGTLALQGRDLSAAAVDDTAPPFNWHNARPDKIIINQARQRGFTKFQVAKVAPIPKLYTDGSESVWELWYRMVRKKKMWVWVDPDGALHVNNLNYAADPTYLFGKPSRGHPNPRSWIPIQRVQIMKNTSTRLGEVWVFGETGQAGFKVEAKDNLIKDWIKRPLKIITADAAHTNRALALKEAQEEIFEGIVGSLEITITIADPGFVVRQNRTCLLNIPELDYAGEFFVVGARMLNGTDGGLQEVRLREKKYALTRRQPQDPALKEEGTNVNASAFGSNLATGKNEWGDYFVVAAKAWNGGYDFSLFLATLLAICQHESSFTNVREGGGPEWTDPPLAITNREQAIQQGQQGQTLVEWKKDFANSAGNPLNPFNREAGVGPMQLTTAAYKHWADERMSIFDEYSGGRWHPSANIWAGARALNSKLQGLTPSEANLWVGVKAYNGTGPAADAYMRAIRQSVTSDWLPQVQAQLSNQQNILPANSTKTEAQYAGSVPDTIRKLINFAERQRGKPYQTGAEGPDTYDCSGLAYACYKAAGLGGAIGGRQSTWGYWANGKGYGNLEFVYVDKLLPGDMVFFSVPSDGGAPPQHMGIYYHDGLMIAAPHTGAVVYAESISAPDVWTCMGGMRMKGIWPVSSDDSSNYEPGFSGSPQHR